MRTIKDLKRNGEFIVATRDGESWSNLAIWDGERVVYIGTRESHIPINLHNKLADILGELPGDGRIYFRNDFKTWDATFKEINEKFEEILDDEIEDWANKNKNNQTT